MAKIVPYPSDAHARKAGALKSQITLADDFDAIPEGFEEYHC